MALTAAAVRVAGTGEIFVAPTATAAPTDVTTALPAAWKGLGLTSTDGVEFNLSRDTSDIDAWQQSRVRVITNAEPVSLKATLMETRTDTLVAAFGGGTSTVATGTSTFIPPKEGEAAITSMVIEFADGTTKYRYYFQRVQITGDLSFNLTRSDAVQYELEWAVLAPSTGTDRFKIITNDTQVVATTLDAGETQAATPSK